MIAYIGIGSNLNKPLFQVQQGLQCLAKLQESTLLKHSEPYCNPAIGPIEQPDFVNAVAKLSTNLSAEELLFALQSIEKQQGRVRTIHWGPRVLDLDLLLYDNLILNTEQLTLPHPEIEQRDFVLKPLLEIEPDLVFPDGISLQEKCHELADIS